MDLEQSGTFVFAHVSCFYFLVRHLRRFCFLRKFLYGARTGRADPPVRRAPAGLTPRRRRQRTERFTAQIARVEPRRQIEPESHGMGSGQKMPQREPGRLAGLIECQRVVRLAFENPRDQSGEDPARSNLDEQPPAVAMHRPDLIGEAHATGHVACE